MAQVTTSTATDVVAPPSSGGITREVATGYLYVAVQTGVGTLTIMRSTNAGASWAAWASFVQIGIVDWSSVVVDLGGLGHIAYRVSTTGAGGTDTIWYRRFTTGTTGAFSNGVQTSANDSNGGTAGATWQGVDIAVVRNPNGSFAIVIAAARTVGTSRYGIQVMGVSIDANSVVSVNNGLIQGTRAWTTSGTAPGRSGVVCEVQHNGNGQYASTPHVWISWGRTRVETVVLAWQGNGQGWQGPTSSLPVRSGLSPLDYPAARWDGVRWMMAAASPDDSTKVRIWERRAANGLPNPLPDSPAHPTGVIRNLALSYDNVTKNVRLYAIGTSTAVLYFVDYTRSTSTWTTWTTVVASAILGATEWSVRKGGTSLSGKHDIVYGLSASPNTVQHLQQSVSAAPTTGFISGANSPYYNGGAADVAVPLPLSWTFFDADVSDTQSSYALSRQIGTGTISYWNATSNTWVAGEIQNASATNGVTLPASWGADADANHTYRVKVWDTSNVPSNYSDALVLVPSVKVNPSVTAPANASNLTVDTLVATWTVAEQTGYRVVLTQTTPATGVVYDSGKQTITTPSITVPYTMVSGTAYSVSITTYNNEGLASTPQIRTFTVNYTAPPAVYSTFVTNPNRGTITITPVTLAPVGTQSTTSSQSLYRRRRTALSIIPNGDFASDASWWFAQGGTMAYSTVQSHSAPGSGRITPTGSAADAQIINGGPNDISTQVAAGKSITVGAWIFPTTATKPIRVQLNWLDATGTYLAQASATIGTYTANAWTYVEFTASPVGVANAARVSPVIGLTSTPAATDVFYVDDVTTREANDSPGTRIVNGGQPGAAYEDWGPRSLRDYEYRWLSQALNGSSTYGPWTG